MVRKKRVYKINCFHHVMLRGVCGDDIFRDNADRVRLCLFIQAASEKYGLEIHGFCFMSNHLHLLALPTKSPIQKGVHSFAFQYAQYFNEKYKRRGYLFQGRFKSLVVDDHDYLKRLIRYIHLNPVVGGLVSAPENYLWSSHNAYQGHAKFTWLITDRVLSYFGKVRSKCVLVLRLITRVKSDEIIESEEILRALNDGKYENDNLIESEKLNTQSTTKPQLPPEILISNALKKVCDVFAVTQEELLSASKIPKCVQARAALALVGKISQGLNLNCVAVALRKNIGTISRLSKLAERNPNLLAIAYKICGFQNKV